MTVSKLKNIYITTPRQGLSGGVATFVGTLKGRLAENEFYLYRGGGRGLLKPLYLIADLIKSLFIVCVGIDAPILMNTSMNNSAWNRDRVLIYLLSLLGKRVYVFIHGWDEVEAPKIIKKSINISILNNCCKIFTLQDSFKASMLSAGVVSPVVQAHTAVDQGFLDHFSGKYKSFSGKPVVLFLARLEENKGVLLFLKAISEVPSDKFEYVICGDGSKVREVEAQVKVLKGSGYHITYAGRVEGRLKEEIFDKSHYYIFPTTHGEGMPISVLEALVAGLVPLVSRQLALESLISEGVSGFFIEDLSPKAIAVRLMDLYGKSELMIGVSRHNTDYAPRTYSPNNLANCIIREVA